MARILKALGLGLVIATIVWLVTLWQWHNAERDIGMADIVVQLVVLPVLLTLGLLAALWGVQRLRAPVEAPAAAPSTGEGALDAALSAEAQAQRDASAWVLAEAVHLPVGADADTAWSTLQAGGARPDLDAHLQDLDGLPVFTARVPEIELDDWLMTHGELSHPDEGGLPPAVLRALALIDAPLHRVLDTLTSLRTELPEDEPSSDSDEALALGDGSAFGKAHLSGVARPMALAQQASREAQRPRVAVRVLWPAHWQEADREAATAWLQSQCGTLLDWVATVNAHMPAWQVAPLAQAESLWTEIDQLLLRWAREPRPELLLLLAVDSALDADRIDHLQAIGELFTAQHQTGRVPGEGAAALLLAHPQWPHLSTQMPEAMRLWRPVCRRRDKSADAAGRIGCTTLTAVLTEVLQRSTPPHEGLMVVSDADHRASRTGELFEALQSVAPELDPLQQVTRVGEACGDLGVARALVPTALACAALRQSDQAQRVAVATHVQSPHERVVVALSPMHPMLAVPEAA
ncbi:MAG: hypothetical protein RBT42_10700 [Aquabacterium sp.]|jgi:hypothetical protein|uniref:hypothetical protein n=1 Tax=Aquabacterium sp. TaxID=1872578 RepID=UPI002A36C3D9|nr:hypothetical protein [Aquabacterium sp.]MDX9844217.1 hypothetical protein [Aquabacterium sp.]